LDVPLPKVKIDGLDVDIDFKTDLLIFLPRVKDRLDKAIEYLRSSGQRFDGIYIAADSDYAPLEKAVRKIHEEYDVRVVADIIGKMADLAMQACGVSDGRLSNTGLPSAWQSERRRTTFPMRTTCLICRHQKRDNALSGYIIVARKEHELISPAS
jgi:hypothetical protein